jgi:hypothetical protein
VQAIAPIITPCYSIPGIVTYVVFYVVFWWRTTHFILMCTKQLFPELFPKHR